MEACNDFVNKQRNKASHYITATEVSIKEAFVKFDAQPVVCTMPKSKKQHNKAKVPQGPNFVGLASVVV